MKAIIMAGGKGTRLASITKNEIPKPMVKLEGKPLLEHQVEQLKRYGITEITMVVGHLANVVMDYFGDGSRFRVSINYVEEPEPLGTAGALALIKMDEDFIFTMGDLYFDFDIPRMVEFHKNKDAFITLLAHPNMHPQDSDLIVADANDRVLRFDSKHNVRDYWFDNLVNAGIFIMSPRVCEYVTEPKKLSLEKELIAPLLEKEKVYAYRTPEYIKDVGTPDRIESAGADIRAGIPAAKNLENKQRAIFIDRDGTINEFKGFVNNIDMLELLPNSSEAIRKINSSGYLAIVVTNQPVIARGEATFEQVEEIHRKMKTLLGRDGCYIDDILYCPHHPDKGFEGEVPELKIVCNCRKPKTGMVEEAARRWNIDVSKSWVVGDGTIDIEMGHRAGCRTVLVETGVAGKDALFEVHPDFVAADLLEAFYDISGQME